MITWPVPWNLFREDAEETARKLPDAAIDLSTYPPFQLVWCLTWFDLTTASIAGEAVLERFDSKALRKIFRRPPSDPMVGAEWPVTARYRDKIERLIGRRLHLSKFSYFIGARAVNFSEVKKAMSHV